MEVKRYKVPSAAYPRYNYSVREGISIYKRYNVILKDIGFGDKCDTISLEEIDEPQIFVACEISTIQTVGDADVELNKLNEVHEIENKSYSDFDTLIKDNNINSKSPKIVVVELKQNTSWKVSDFVKWKNNVIIVVKEKYLLSSINDDVHLTNKENLGREICLMLERITFRKMLPLINVLRGLLTTADFQPLTHVVGTTMSDGLNAFLKNEKSFVGWMNDIENKMKCGSEIGPKAERNFEKYLHRDFSHEDRIAFKSDVNTEYIVKFEKRRQEKGKVEYKADDDIPIPTATTDEKTVHDKEIETATTSTTVNHKAKTKRKREKSTLQVVEYFEDNDLMYELVGKLAEHISHTLEQEVITEYKMLPKEFRNLLNVEIEREDIKNEVAEQLFKLFVCTIDSKLEKDDPAEEMIIVKLRYRTGVIMRGLRDVVAQLELLAIIDHHIELIKVESDRAINRLLGDLIGLFGRSMIPDSERPKSGEFKRLNDKVAAKLLEAVKEAKGCGYRYDKLHIFIEEIIDQEKKETIESDIRKILVGFNISDYIVSSTTSPVEHYKQVGAKIRVARSGTLGGFALMGEHEHLCALLSKHVVNGALEVRYKGNSDHEIVIGSMIQAEAFPQEQHDTKADSDEGHVIGAMVQSDVGQKRNGKKASSDGENIVDGMIQSDIDKDNNKVVAFASKVEDNALDDNVVVDFVDVAAAKILDSVKSDCDTFFKDSKRQPKKSKLCNFTDDTEIKDLFGLKVHIRGASTELGTGIITIPEFHVKGNKKKFVVIEDIEDGGETIARFSREGDSGAVICADHPDGEYVQVISMLVGCMNYEKISESEPKNKKNIGEYMSFRMINGLESLKLETKQEFKLCNAY